jgi:hypothetical protein
MATKTFKIGEYAKGGIIKVSTKDNKIDIVVIDMFDKTELYSHKETINGYDFINCNDIERRIFRFLHEITISYYAAKIMNWLKDKTGLKFIWC